MRRTVRVILAAMVLIGFATATLTADVGTRQIVDLNPGWKFIKRDVGGAEQIATDDSAWESINLPHTWNNLDGQDGGNDYYRGIGWYRLHLKSDPSWADKELYLKFDAASVNSSVFVNGKQAGTHAGAFGAFCFDITSLVNLTGDNVVAVKVSNAKNPNVAPLAGDFTVFGGIYRGVHLLVLNPLCASPVDDASSGVYVRQDKVDSDNAALTVISEVLNVGPNPKIPSVKTEFLDATGTLVATATQRGLATIGTGGSEPIRQSIAVPHPHLWNGRTDPYLYTVRVSVLDDSTVTDVVEQPVGFRFFRVDPNTGFYLNGQPYRLYGVNRHQDHQDEGWAISVADHQNDFNDMMEMGCTGVRLSHYQHAQEFYDLCDRGGMVVWAEIPVINRIGTTPEFADNASQQLRELIKQNFNHPSICFWSLSNELGNGLKGREAAEQQEPQVALMKRLNAEAKQLDPTRLTTDASLMGPGRPQDAITDVVAFNRYDGWYVSKPESLGPDLDKLHKAYPDRGVGLSEYGAGAAISQHEANLKQPKPGGKWHPEEWQALVHEQAWAAIKARPWVWGSFLWAEHDFASDGRNEGEHAGRNDKGLITYDGKTRKDAFYFYKANWSTDPFVYITDRRFTPRAAADAPVKIYSNCDSVELSVNGKSLGSAVGSDIKVFRWDKVQLQPGENHLQATGTRDGKKVTDSCVIVLDPNASDGHATAMKPN